MWVLIIVILVLSSPWTLRWIFLKPEIWRHSDRWSDTYRGYTYICVQYANPCLAMRLKMKGYKFKNSGWSDDPGQWIKYSNNLKLVYKEKICIK